MSALRDLPAGRRDGTDAAVLPELPLLRATLGPAAAAIGGLSARAGIHTYDPGLGETAICRSAITYVDGENGVLLYRGYPTSSIRLGAARRSAGCSR